MSIAFESPSQRRQASDAYFTPMTVPNSMLTTNSSSSSSSASASTSAMSNHNGSNSSNNSNEDEGGGSTTPYFTAPISPMIHQDFLNAIHQRHSSQPTVFTPTFDKKPTVSFAATGGGSIADRRRAARQQALLNMPTTAPSSPPSMPPNHLTPSSSPLSSTGLLPIQSEQLANYLSQQQTSTLVLDVRSFVQFSHARIRQAINVSIPNTILKRPTFTMEKVYEAIMEADRARLKQWPSHAVVVFYDQSSMVALDQCATSYLANKMIHAGFNGSLFYLQGGLDAFQSLYPDLCIASPLPPSTNGQTSNSLPFLRNKIVNGMKTPSLHLGSLPPASSAPLNLGPYTAPMPHFENQAFNPFFSNIRQNMELSHGPIKERFPIRLPDHCHPVLLDDPDHTLLIEMDALNPTPRLVAGATLNSQQEGKHVFKAPRWLQNTMVDYKTLEIGTVSLAELYEKLERTEQRRLQNIMHFHSKDTTTDPSDYPLSIVAGIEMGALNRYTNIWPFEYTRVKIQDTPSGSTGYINASFIQYYQQEASAVSPTHSSPSNLTSTPPSSSKMTTSSPLSTVSTIPSPSPTSPANSTNTGVTSPSHSPSSGQVNPVCLKMMKSSHWYQQPYRRYISTQGPLPSTFDDFWQVVWEQNSRVVVMLTKEEEMNKIKCHRYWPSELNQSIQYGSTRLTLTAEREHKVAASDWKEDVIYEREFLVEKSGQSARHITQLHYTGWMDYGVPDNPLGTLQLVQLADRAQRRYESASTDQQVIGPMVIHCSAGCGRSGAFCAIDTVLRRLTLADQQQQQCTADALWDIIFRFREQRLSMVQTLRQFVFCYEVVWWWFLGYGRQQNQDDMEF
ncbi:protein-tyrosine phosphatase-like protein [Absidia repens]|uniref:protein-tyrosine-phosphatase n=1 Tax=Absidia repens TaxID=90262 RepID=A0A1X2IKL7_9FUNG|nr:protein-tyrosine phosphatase-like protein [Absidia repens]